jgi:hypothetical protein
MYSVCLDLSVLEPPDLKSVNTAHTLSEGISAWTECDERCKKLRSVNQDTMIVFLSTI